MVNQSTKPSNPAINLLIICLISFAYSQLSVIFIAQHIVTSSLHIPVLLGLMGILFFPTRLVVHHINHRLAMLPMWLRIWFVGLMVICGGFFYVLGPVLPPDTAGWANIPLLTTIEPFIKALTIVIVGASGLAVLLITAIGIKDPILPRFVIVTSFFCTYLMVGLFIYDDYGISIDELVERETSIVSANYVVANFNQALALELFGDNVADIHTYRDRHYGVGFQLPLALIEKLNDFDNDIRDVWLYRHFAVFLFYFCGVVVFYRLASEKFGSWQLGMVGVALLVFTPHIFGQTFNNIKDPVFMAAFTMTLYGALRYWRQKSIKNAVIFGVVSAFASNVRIVTIFILIFVVLYVISLELFSPRTHTNKRTKRQTLVSVAAIFMAYFPFQILLFPASWSNPLYFNTEALIIFAKYSKWDGYILYMGDWIRGQFVPWHYLPVWFSITIPITYQILFLIGATFIIRLIITKRHRLITDNRREEVILLLLFICPVVALIGLRATMYNDWRQFYFLYIPYLMIVLYAIQLLWGIFINPNTQLFIKRGMVALSIIALAYQLFLGAWMLINHPYQNMFRVTPIVELLGGRNNFDRDMSRAVSRQGYEYILSIDKSNSISVCAFNGLIEFGSQILPQAEQARLKRGFCIEDAQYILNAYRNPTLISKYPSAIYTIAVDGVTILSVHRLTP